MPRGRKLVRNVYPPTRWTRRNTRKPKAPQKDIVSIGGNIPPPPSSNKDSDNESSSSELESGHQPEKVSDQNCEGNIGCLSSTPFDAIDDEDMYKLVPETANAEDLFQAKNRMEMIVKNKKFLNRLPDGGDKLKAMCDRVVSAYEKFVSSKAPCFYTKKKKGTLR